MRVLGLDITDRGIFGVELDSAFGRFEVRDTHEILFDPSIDPSEINPLSAAQQMVQSLSGHLDRLITSVPTEISTFRNIQLGTRDRKAIRSALEFELEDDLPFEKENLHYDSAIMPGTGAGSLVHVGACKKDSFAGYLNRLSEYQVDPTVVTTDPWAYRSLMNRIFSKTGNKDPVLLIGIERTKTFFYVHQDHRPILYREISFGQRNIEQALRTGINANDAEIRDWIQDFGLTDRTDDQVAQLIAQALEPLVPEIKQTELSARATLLSSIEQIYVTGEMALMPGLTQWLETVTQRHTTLFKPLAQVSAANLSYSDMSEARFSKALALAMVAVPVDKIPAINLRKGEFAKTNISDSNFQEMLFKIVPYAALVFAVFISTKAIEYQYYKGKYSETEETLHRAVKNYYGGVSEGAVRTYLADTTKLKKTIQTDLAKEREMAKLFSQNPNSPVDLLKSLSSKIGKDIVLDMVEFSAGSETTEPYKDDRPIKASMTVMVSNPQGLVKLTELLERNFNFKKDLTREVTEDGRKIYKVSFSGLVASKGAK